METKKKEVTVGVSEDMMNLITNWMNKAIELNEEYKNEKEKKIGDEVKRAIAGIALKELEKIKEEFGNDNLEDAEWFKLVEKLDKISDLIKWY